MVRRVRSAAQIAAMTEPGNHWVGPSLYLQIRPNGARSWLFHYRRAGRTRGTGWAR
jgi:hypothetical protein